MAAPIDLRVLPCQPTWNIESTARHALGDAFFEAQNLVDVLPDRAEDLWEEVMAWHNSIPPTKPGATNKSMSAKGCSGYVFPGL